MSFELVPIPCGVISADPTLLHSLAHSSVCSTDFIIHHPPHHPIPRHSHVQTQTEVVQRHRSLPPSTITLLTSSHTRRPARRASAPRFTAFASSTNRNTSSPSAPTIPQPTFRDPTTNLQPLPHRQASTPFYMARRPQQSSHTTSTAWRLQADPS